jgi:hypothetical protein
MQTPRYIPFAPGPSAERPGCAAVTSRAGISGSNVLGRLQEKKALRARANGDIPNSNECKSLRLQSEKHSRAGPAAPRLHQGIFYGDMRVFLNFF